MTRQADATQVYLAEHDPNWAVMARDEAARIAPVVGANLIAVHHIGSTSIPGICAKPTVDLMPIVRSLEDLEAFRPAIEALGYMWRGEFGIEGRRYCPLERDGRRIFHTHFYAEGSPHIARQLAFRDYLRANRDEALAYEAAKRAAAAAHPHDSLAYNGHKGAWMKDAIARAEAWAAR